MIAIIKTGKINIIAGIKYIFKNIIQYISVAFFLSARFSRRASACYLVKRFAEGCGGFYGFEGAELFPVLTLSEGHII